MNRKEKSVQTNFFFIDLFICYFSIFQMINKETPLQEMRKKFDTILLDECG